MNAGPLWQVSVQIAPEAEDAVAELLGRLWNTPASVQTDVRNGLTLASVFLENASAWTPRRRAELRAGLQHIRDCGLTLGAGRIAVRRVRREDWSESWKRHFKPLEIGHALLIKPDWSRRRPRKGQAVVVLNPGLSFGTGQHPTTQFCLEQIATVRTPECAQSFLDLGTGSGILAIAAAKLGYRPVAGIDFDREAVRIARENARQNGVSIRLQCQDLTRLSPTSSRRYTLICANLTHDLLTGERRRILARLSHGGRLVLAGILRSQFQGVRRAYCSLGLRLLARRAVGEWESGAFVLV